ncbi:MAG TPA: hypothetical protein VGM90_10720 [Kofleriaceae bacterium]|jgi:hypothetical protein
MTNKLLLAALSLALAPTAFADRSPAEFTALLARYDAATSSGDKALLGDQVDAAAGQRYATVSRLYWYEDLEQAKAAAAASGKPILELRMLGRLDEDQSCANSRLFRATLYANQAVAKQMRENFILLWTSERPVPKVTIDFGDGRTLQTTITGNSAHYILDAEGDVVDVLPGMYAPDAFRAELTKSAVLARRIAAVPPAKRASAIREAHGRALVALNKKARELKAVEHIPGTDPTGKSYFELAQRATISKAYIEVPKLPTVRAGDALKLDEGNTAAWSALGAAWWSFAPPRSTELVIAPTVGAVPPVLDTASQALVLDLEHGALEPGAVGPSDDAMILARLEQHLLADSALNELRLRRAIHERMYKKTEGFAPLNAYVYAEVFHTPASDPWLGLVPRSDFTGMPGDGVHVPATSLSSR